MKMCQAKWAASLDLDGQRPCHRKATRLAIDEEGERFYLCGTCARGFEAAMVSVKKLEKDRPCAAKKP